jgi:phage tail sheath protein FI
MAYNTPGVFVEEISKIPPSVAEVETAIPAFIGYTEKATLNGASYLNKPVRIKSLVEYEQIFGGPYAEKFAATVATVNSVDQLTAVSMTSTFTYRLYYALQLYFANGGGPCYIISVGNYTTNPVVTPPSISATLLTSGLTPLAKEDEPTIILFPDAVSITGANAEVNFYNIYQQALAQCGLLKDRFTLCDVYNGNLDFQAAGGTDVINDGTVGFRTLIGTSDLKYGAAYYPWLRTLYNFHYLESEVTVTGGTIPANTTMLNSNTAISLFHINNGLYHNIKNEIIKNFVLLPPSAALAGVYATVDRTRGVWKAPANVSLKDVKEPLVTLDDDAQAGLNVDSTGKSVNAIRTFSGKGVMVWGVRTLAGNDNEWRYINVRRFFNMVEESVKKASSPFVFEPNDASTWAKVRGMIENFLTIQWRNGALQGAKADDSYFVRIGLGQTMTALDILEGRMNVEIGMAVVRPAEFIILKFSHKMQVS